MTASLSALTSVLPTDPAGFVALHQKLPLWGSGALAGAGLVLCLLGVERMVMRAFFGALGAAAGWLTAPTLAQFAGFSESMTRAVAAGVFALVGVLSPEGVAFALGGALGAFLGATVVGEPHGWIGAVPGFLLIGALAFAFIRLLSAVMTSVIGALAFTLGMITLLSHMGFQSVVTASPIADLIFAGTMALGGIIFQLKVLPTPAQRARGRIDRKKAKQAAKDAKNREARFKEYDKRMG